MAKICQQCKKELSNAQFIGTNSPLHTGAVPICRKCLNRMIQETPENKRWNIINKILQWMDVPFMPAQWEKFSLSNGKDALGVYCSIFRSKEYETLDWTQYNQAYLQLQEESRLEDAIPELKEKNLLELKRRWGYDYDDFALEYLENLYEGILRTQNIAGNLQEDQLLKLCKISLKIENKIRADEDIDKDVKTYDSLVKLIGLTPKDIKNGKDFDSMGEIFEYLEQTNWINRYDFSVARDEVDNAIKNIQNWNKRLYTNETGISEEIEQRIANLKTALEIDKNLNYSDDDFDEGEFDGALDDEEFELDL